MGGLGDTPRPGRRHADRNSGEPCRKRPSSLARIVAAIPSGESPDGTGGSRGSPVLPKPFSNTFLAGVCESDALAGASLEKTHTKSNRPGLSAFPTDGHRIGVARPYATHVNQRLPVKREVNVVHPRCGSVR
jgi:hypothetical protein